MKLVALKSFPLSGYGRVTPGTTFEVADKLGKVMVQVTRQARLFTDADAVAPAEDPNSIVEELDPESAQEAEVQKAMVAESSTEAAGVGSPAPASGEVEEHSPMPGMTTESEAALVPPGKRQYRRRDMAAEK